MLWEELTQVTFNNAVKESAGVCVLPIGVLEKHGKHLPLGTDMMTGTALCKKAAEMEKAVVFPYYFLGQISEARHYKGTIAASHKLMMDALLEMCDEIHRNGFHKIILMSSHGGNGHFLPYFAQQMNHLNRDYNVYSYFCAHATPEQQNKINDFTNGADLGSHAGLSETAVMMHLRPELVDMAAQPPKEGEDMGRMKELRSKGVFTNFDWYGHFPHHYAGDHSTATPELGKLLFDIMCENLADLIRFVKEDKVSEELRCEFNQACRSPE